MGGFKNEILNSAFGAGIINIIIDHLIGCSKQMRVDCITSDKLLKNDEDFITNKLIAVYLNAGPGILRYEPQTPEHYNDVTGRYNGRTDIKVISGDYFRDEKAYYIVECKRIDGSNTLNQKYITEGVERFFSPVPKPKYSSYYMQNIMFGYVVQSVVIPNNADEIDRLQDILLKGAKATGFELEKNDTEQIYIYRCKYFSASAGCIELRHLFFDFADAICAK